MSVPPRRCAALLAVIAAVPLAVFAVAGPGDAATPKTAKAAVTQPAVTRAASAAATSKYHPYSDPVYYPLRVEAVLDCVRSNPGCKNGHTFWGIDETPTNQTKTGPSTGRVYAMGAGVLHIAHAHGDRCGTASSFGTEVWIDHGGGVLSRYGHLSHIYGKSGQYVKAGQAIGIVGDTGKRTNCGRIYYTDYNVKHHGYLGVGVQITSLRACARNKTTVSYPRAVTKYSIWNKVPQGTVIAAPAGGSSCLPTHVPATASQATGVSVSRSGSGQLTIRWTKPSSKYHVGSVLVELGQYHPSVHRYDYAQNEKYVVVSASKSTYEFHRLQHGATYHLRVEFHNATGWSRYGGWHVRSAS